MCDHLSRTRRLLGDAAMDKLRGARVAVFGVGGVGGYAAEALARSGIGAIDLIDNDTVSVSNINRQIIALRSTVGMYKTEVMAKRIEDIDPSVTVRTYNVFYSPETAPMFDMSQYTYVVDAVDTVSAKIELIVRAKESETPIISSMGAGNKLDPTAFEVADIYKTSVCPLAKVMRYELKKRGITSLKTVYSKEPPIKPDGDEREGTRRFVPGSVSFVPSAVGLIIAGEVIKEIIK